MQHNIIENDFKIKFDGQQHQVDANVLISSLIHTTTIIQQINNHFNSGKKVEIKVKALEKGSFLIHIELLETAIDTLKNLFTKENIEFAGAVIGGLVGLIELKKFLSDKEPTEKIEQGNTVIIINQNNERLIIDSTIYELYDKNITIKDALTQNFDVLNNDPAIEAFEITDKHEKPYIRIEKEDFASMATKSSIIQEGERQIVEASTLHVIRVSFEKDLKWDFYNKGSKITAKINDPGFYELIDKGEAFAKGDILEVELQINQKYDDSVVTWVTKSYVITKIIRHIKRGEQQRINFNSES
jgi:hypothetical protein